MTSPPTKPHWPHLSSGAQPTSWILSLSSTLSSCDSRNLDLSPLCNTSATSLVMWQPSMEATYGNVTANYVSGIPGPMRPKFPGDMAGKELITSLTKVLIRCRINDIFHFRKSTCTTHMRRTSHWWTFTLEAQPYLVKISFHPSIFSSGSWKSALIIFCHRVWEIPEDDLARLHLQLRRDLRPLPWGQLCLRHWDCLLVFNQAFQKLLMWNCAIYINCLAYIILSRHWLKSAHL